jgi:hypothetical protein
MNRCCGFTQLPSTGRGGNGLRASARTVALCAPLAIGLALLCSPAASAANGSRPPKPQGLWRAYPLHPRALHPTQNRPAGEVRHTKPGAVSTPPAPAAASGHGAARALEVLAATTVGVILLLLVLEALIARRRAGAEPAGDGSSRRRRLLRALSQEHGSLAAARRADRRSDAAPIDGRPSPGAAAGAHDTLLESTGSPSRPRVVKAERIERAEPVERRPTPTPERARPTADEKAALKRTTETLDLAAVAKLKAKRQASEALKDARQRDLTLLKAKLGGPQTTLKRAPAPKQARTATPLSAQADPAAMPPASEATTEETNRPRRPTPTTSRCRIEWRRDGNESLFCAMVRTPRGDESVLLDSPPFEWREDTPPSKELPQVGSAHLALVSNLVADGWVATGSGERWYALELKRTTDQLRPTNRQEGRT